MSKFNDAILLCRISDEKQKDGYSLEAQERIGREYCGGKGFNISNVFRFVETGSKSHDRKKFDAMMDFVRSYTGSSDRALHLIVEKPDRLTRNFTNREQLQFFVMSGKLVIHYYKDRRILDKSCSPADIFTDDIMTSVNKYIALNIARETRKGMNEKAKNGWFPGHAPMGYKNIRVGGENKHGRKEARIVVDESARAAVLRIFELRALKGFSYYAIRDQILAEGLLPEKRVARFSKSSIEGVLNNPFYEGKFFWDGEWYTGKHESFVPPAWIQLAKGKRGTPNKNVFEGRFSYMITCDVPGCGCTVIYDPKTKTNKTTGESRVYHYYHCADGKRLHKIKKIRQINVSEKLIWDSITQPLRDLSLSDDLAKFLAAQIEAAGRVSLESADQQRKTTRARLTELESKEEELYEHWSGGLLGKEIYTRNLERMKEERGRLNESMIRLENVGEDVVDEKSKFLLELCKRAESAWKKGDEEQRLGLVKKFCSNFRLDGLTLRYDLKSPYKILLELKRNTEKTRWCPKEDLNLHSLAATGF